MKRWFAVTAVWAMASTFCDGQEDWVALELKEAANRLDQQQFAQAHDIYRNLLLAHQVMPLSATHLGQVRSGIASTAGRLKAEQVGTFSSAFLERVKSLGFLQAGAAWLPPTARDRLSPDAISRLGKMARAKPCPACRGLGVNVCANCERGQARCMACNATGRTGGSSVTFRGTTCVLCDGRGKVKCAFCKGIGFAICPKCEGLGSGD